MTKELTPLEKAAKSEGWTLSKESLPEWLPDGKGGVQGFSANVLAIVDNHPDVQVMCLCWVIGDFEDGSDSGLCWANCYGELNGDSQFDDDYDVIAWRMIPTYPIVKP